MKNHFYNVWVIQLLIFGFIGLTCQEQVANLSSVIEALFEGQDNTVPPYHFLEKGSRTEISVGLNINEIYAVNSQDMSYRMSCFLRLSWKDPRLDLNNLTPAVSIDLPSAMRSHMWLPDLYFPNERDGDFHEIPAPNEWIRISKNGQIFVSRRYSLLLSCPFYLQRFPLDTQFCKFDLELYHSMTNTVHIKWNEIPGALELPKNLSLVDFELVDHYMEERINTFATGNFSSLRFTFQLDRIYDYYVVLVYAPAVLIVAISWLTFWIDPECVPARVSLGVTTVLSILTLTFLSGLAMPMVPYVKAIDVWLLGSVVFVCLSFVEFIIVLIAKNREISLRKKTDDNISEDHNKCAKCYRYIYSAKGIDDLSKVLFPVLFALCGTIYWVFYISWDNKSEKYV